ncbi:TPA: phage tail tube protein [Clostridioides difficile]|uniref:phage tail tube protein n=1 Tax=Clostridioides difficile TaxID=1496 RepID=UPI0010340315|nr:phage tail tube protein [Clostridioides difficile]HBF0144799.1 hypothetical protein [Clostridioides difficile]HBF0148602.1 hypothetical protein [Clostridioides difficile]HCQ5593783.1 hypothetical protein [Clostridioides difficile]
MGKYDENIIDAANVADGSNAKIIVDGKEEGYGTEFTAEVENDKKTFRVIGCKWELNKASTQKGTFSLTVLKTTSEWIERGFDKFELISEIENPGLVGYERIRYKNCMVDKIQLVSIKADENIEIQIDGTFEGYELVDKIA